MKPPSRRRVEPSRFRIKSTEQKQTVIVRSLWKGWSRKDQRNFLQGLKQQQNFQTELDLTELQKKVPQRSLQEIEDLIKTLKSRVLQRVFLQVRSQRKCERKTKVPIEIWSELVQNIFGSHEKTISSAFSQMLVIAATEPCSLMHSNPPHSINIQTSLHTVPIRPITNVQLCSSVPSTTPQVTVLPNQSPQTLTRPFASGISPSTALITTSRIQSDSSSIAVDHNNEVQVSNASSSSLKSNTPKTPTPKSTEVTKSSGKLESEPEPTVSSPASVSLSNTHTPTRPESSDQDCLHRPRVLKCIVNFEKIYHFINDVDSKTCSSALTSMESAILLDLLMTLPEELPLLDCKELQHHLLQLHTHLASSKTDRNSQHANGVDSTVLTMDRRTTTFSSGNPSSQLSATEPAKDKEDWATAGISPLNPLLIPVALLKRQSQDSSNR